MFGRPTNPRDSTSSQQLLGRTQSSPLGREVALDLAECVFCFEPLSSVKLCVLRKEKRERACRHIHHIDCIRRDKQYVKETGGRDLRCPVCNQPYKTFCRMKRARVGCEMAKVEELFSVLGGSSDQGLDAHDAKDMLKAMFPLDVEAVDDFVDGPWREAVGHTGVNDPDELSRMIEMANRCAGRLPEPEPPLLGDDAAAWFTFWAGSSGYLTRDTLVRALAKTLPVQRDQLEAIVSELWDFFCEGRDSMSCAEFVKLDGMADALVAAILESSSKTVCPTSQPTMPDAWSCMQCTLHNPRSVVVCKACSAPRPGHGSFVTQPPCARCGRPHAPAEAAWYESANPRYCQCVGFVWNRDSSAAPNHGTSAAPPDGALSHGIGIPVGRPNRGDCLSALQRSRRESRRSLKTRAQDTAEAASSNSGHSSPRSDSECSVQ